MKLTGKSLKKILAISLASVMTCATMAVTSLAASATCKFELKGTKILTSQSGDLAKIPAETFKFKVEPQDGAPSPENTETTVSYDGNGVAGFNGAFSFGDITFDRVSDMYYTYKVTEVAPAAANQTTGMTYDKSYYIVNIGVTNTDDGSGIEVNQVIYHKYIYNEETGEYNQDTVKPLAITFTNDYNHPEAGLNISKTVAGKAGDKKADYTFTVKFYTDNTKAHLLTSSVSYTGTGSDYAGNAPAAGSITGTGTIKLKHGQGVSFAAIPVGTYYEVVETQVTGYTVYIGTASFNGDTVLTGTPDADATTAGVITVGNTSTANYTNFKPYTPDTGINMNMIPFAVLFVTACAGAVVFFAAKKRKEEQF